MKPARLPAALLGLLLFSGGCARAGGSLAPAASDAFQQARLQIHLKGPSPLTAGVAKVEITPPVGTPLAGYSKRKGKPSVGIRDPLYVRALALGDGEDRVVIISADLLIFPQPLMEKIVKRIQQEMQLPRQSIILAATHTHSGTGAIAPGALYEIVFGPYRPQVVEGIVGRLTWAVRQAMERQRPVSWGAGKGALPGFTENRTVSGGAADPRMDVLYLQTAEGKPLAVLVNLAAHPTLLDSKDMRFSADYPGEVARLLEESYVGSVCLFLNGAAGDVRPRDAIAGSPEERLSRFGRVVREKVQGIVNQMAITSKGDLATWGEWFSLPPPRLFFGPIPIPPAVGRMMRPTTSFQNLCALDKVLLVPLSAELTTELGQELRAALSGKGFEPILVGYANGYLGYAVTPQQYRGKSYEAWMTWYGASFGRELAEWIDRLAALRVEEGR